MKKIYPEELEVILGQIVAKKASHFKHIAIDGKSIRSTNLSAEGLLHLLSAYAPEIKGVLLQSKSGVGGGEIISGER